MKITKNLLRMALGGMLLTAGPVWAQSPMVSPWASDPTGSASVGHIGDDAGHIGDSAGFDLSPSAGLSPDRRPSEFTKIGDQSDGDRYVSVLDDPGMQPTGSGVMDMQTIPMASYAPTTCSGSASTCFQQSSSETLWADAELLLWFGQGRRSPALVTTAPAFTLPVSGAANVTDAFGGNDTISGGIMPGYRFSIGRWFGDGQNFGVGARVFGIGNAKDSFAANSNGVDNGSIGRAFFNTTHTSGTAQADAGLVAYNVNAGTNIASGAILASSTLKMVGTDVYGRMLMAEGKGYRSDLLAGYTFNNLQDSILVNSFTNSFNGDTFDVTDDFRTKNVFHGGMLGISNEVREGKWSLSTLGKVSFGNFGQTVTRIGNTVATSGGVPTTTAQGTYVQATNAGTVTTNQFGFIPELGIKLGRDFTPNLKLTVGYSFLYWSNVALAGNQVDDRVDGAAIFGGVNSGPTPLPTIVDGGFWMQGVDLGLTYTY